MKPIIEPIFRQPDGYWWAFSQVKPNRVYSLHTKDRAKAQALYDMHISSTYRAFDEADAAMDGVQEQYRLVEPLLFSCTDWDETQMPDGATPLDSLTCGDLRKVVSALSRLQQRVKELTATERVLREALEPFAKIVDQHESGAWIWGINEPSLEDARRARAALSIYKEAAE